MDAKLEQQIREVVDLAFQSPDVGKSLKSKVVSISSIKADVQRYATDKNIWITVSTVLTDEKDGEEKETYVAIDGIVKYLGKYYDFTIIIELCDNETSDMVKEFCDEDVDSDNSILEVMVKNSILAYNNRTLGHRYTVTRYDDGGWGSVTRDSNDDIVPMSRKCTKEDIYDFFRRFCQFKAKTGNIWYDDGTIVIERGSDFGTGKQTNRFKIEDYKERNDLGRRS
jgi:hypothetical protein